MVGTKHVAAARRLGSDAVTAEVVQAMRDGGIRSLLFKGPVLERWLYTDGIQREYRDIDLLVAPANFERAEAALAEIGFRMPAANWRRRELQAHERDWERGQHTIDLHRGIWGVEGDWFSAWSAFTAQTDEMQIAGTVVEVPVASTQAMLVALHALLHSDGRNPLEDLRRALQTADDATWREAAGTARQVGAIGAFTLGLDRLESGQELLGRLGLAARPSAEERLHAAGTAPGSVSFLRLAEQPTTRARIGFALAKLGPSPGFMRWRYGVARRGRAGLVASYVWRPLTMCRQAPGGWRAWRGAERHARRG